MCCLTTKLGPGSKKLRRDMVLVEMGMSVSA